MHVKTDYFLLLGKQEGVVISLDCAYGEFLTEDRVVISLKGGELYVLTLVADSMRSVRSFHFDKAAASVLTCSVCITYLNFRIELFFRNWFGFEKVPEVKILEKIYYR